MTTAEVQPRTALDDQQIKNGEFPTFISALDGLVEMEFWGWTAEHPDSAEYRDQRGEIVPVHRMTDGRLVADLRED